MSTEQQPKPQIMPSLADLDKPPVKPEDKPQQTITPTETPVATTTTTVVESPAPKDPATVAAEQAKKEAEELEKKPEGQNTEGLEEEEEEQDNPMAIWEEVNKLRGEEIKWDFPEGVSPDSPEGVHHSLKVIEDHAIDRYEKWIKDTLPRAYSYLLHISNGGTDEQFFETKTEPIPDLEAMKTSVDSQSAFYKRALQRRGVEAEHADLIIKDAITGNKLFGLVEKEHAAMKANQEAQVQQLLELDKTNKQREEAAINTMSNVLREHILENKSLNITIPDARRSEFLQFVSNLVMFDKDSGKFFINQEISKENIGLVLESLYYMNVKGNIAEIIRKRADAENVRRLRLKMGKDKKMESTQTDPGTKKLTDKPGVQPALSEL